jgi:hypothetical protein
LSSFFTTFFFIPPILQLEACTNSMEIQGRMDGCTLGGNGRGRLGLDGEKEAVAAMRVGRGWGREREGAAARRWGLQGGGEGKRGRLGLDGERGPPIHQMRINNPKLTLTSELPAPAKECQKRPTVYLRYVPPKTPNPTSTEHEKKEKEI